MAHNKGTVDVKHKCGHVRTHEFETIQDVATSAREIREYEQRHVCYQCRIDSRHYALGRVYIDSPVDENQADDTIAAYYCVNDSWNGWAMTYFTKEQGMAYLEWQNRRPWDTKPGYYDEAQDAFVTFIQEDTDEGDVWTAEQIKVGDEFLTVYPIGCSSWVWEVKENEPEVSREELLDRLHDAVSAMDDSRLATLVSGLEKEVK